jgi:hypothetical protein
MERALTKVQKEMLALERFFPQHHREKAEQTLFALAILFLSFAVFFNIVIDTRAGSLWPVAEGLFLITFSLLLITILIEIYFHSLRKRLERKHEMSFAALLVIGLHYPRKKDLTKAFLHSRLGKEVALRLGIARETVHHFMSTKENVDMKLPTKGYLQDVAGHIHEEDPYFRDFLDRVHVSKDLLMESSKEVETKHHRHLASRHFLSHAFPKKEEQFFSIDHVARREIEELERFYKIIITEQATQQIVAFFREEMMRYVSEEARTDLLTELIEFSLSAHKERFHGASIILPADVRHFLISKKAVV